jgi:HPt (histidine-containing phosphotransfer) domain-containing protein
MNCKGPRQETATLPPPPVVGVNWNEALKNVNGDHELLKQLIQAFQVQAPDVLAALQRAVEQQDKAAMRLHAHTLKGSTLFLGTTPVWHECFRLEKIGGGQEKGDPQKVLAKVQSAVESLLETLQQVVAKDPLVTTPDDQPDARPAP